MVLGCRCGVELVVCVSVVRVGVCLRRCWWCFGGVVAGVLGECGTRGVCSRLLEMADVRVPLAKRGEPEEGGQIMNFGRTIGISLACVFVRFGAAIGISSVFECVCL